MLMKSLLRVLIFNIVINSIHGRLIEINIHYHVNSKNDTQKPPNDSIRIFPSFHHDSLSLAEDNQEKNRSSNWECQELLRPDYQRMEGLTTSVYKLHNEAATWNQARKICKTEGASLGVINSNLEVEALIKLLRENNKNFGYPYVYLGYHDLFEEGEFVMLNDQPLETSGYVLWAPGEPNGHKRENCGSMLRSGLLNDISCSLKLAFICEKSIASCKIETEDDEPNPTMIDWRFDIVNP